MAKKNTEPEKLAQDAAAALAAGMTYGKYMAMKHSENKPVPKPPQQFTAVCKCCGKGFIKDRFHLKYCSYECREKYSEIRKREYIKANRNRIGGKNEQT